MHHEVPPCKLKPGQQPETAGLLVKPVGGPYQVLITGSAPTAPQHVAAHTCIIYTEQSCFQDRSYAVLSLQYGQSVVWLYLYFWKTVFSAVYFAGVCFRHSVNVCVGTRAGAAEGAEEAGGK